MLKKISTNPRLVALIDGTGALLTAFSLGLVMTQFETSFGMPKRILYLLALLGIFFAAFSLGHYLIIPKKWKFYLTGIISANLSYCLLSIALVSYFYPQLTTLGVLYFTVEMFVILGVVYLERLTLLTWIKT